MNVYYVSHGRTTPAEPSPGWYYGAETEDGEEYICGPFATKGEALDDMSGGAYSDWCESKADERRDLGSYRDQMRDAGRGHLLRGDE